MAQAKRPRETETHVGAHITRGLREGALLLLLALAAYFLLALTTYSPRDPGWSFVGSVDLIHNRGGRAGAWFADVFLYLFGLFAYLFPVMVGYSGWLVYRQRGYEAATSVQLITLRWLGFLVTLASGSALATLHVGLHSLSLPHQTGGILGDAVGSLVVAIFNPTGATLLLLAVFLVGFTLFTGISWLSLMDGLGRLTLESGYRLREFAKRLVAYFVGRRARMQRTEVVRAERKKTGQNKPPRIEPVIKVIEPSKRVEKERQVPLFEPDPHSELPPLSLLEPAPPAGRGYSREALEAMSRQVELKLRDFGIEVVVEAVHPGPVITRFEIQPAAGVKVSQISNLSKDLARALSTISVRVVEVIPGKSVVGLEIPNEYRETVYLSEILRSSAFDKAGSPLTLALGKDISGQPVVVDLAKMPHLLIAGTTGSGKSVGLNAMVLSLLFKTLPKDVRLIMIDPKMLELSVYEGIPHLLAPVVTDMKEAANALRWCVAEMERRYRLMAALGVRNLAGFNRKLEEAEARGEPIADPMFVPDPLSEDNAVPNLQALPYIVVIIDELADMMMIVGKKVEELIARLAQKARASGIHLILATQRPSVDVITGLIKANIPTRIAFQVSSRIDSRTILDQMGAEQLLGHGDMLYLAPGTGIPTRIHGAFVQDAEVHRVAKQLKSTGRPDYLNEILDEPGEAIPGISAEPGENGGEADPLYDEAVRIVTESRRASISGVQRRLKVGYNRAARMIEEMEQAGIVSALQSNGNRDVLAPPPPEV